jgi:hypothetical protein
MGNVINDDQLSELAERPDVLIRRATLVLPGGRRIVCDFTSLTAFGQTSATFAIEVLIGTTHLVLKDIDDADMQTATRALSSAPERPAAEQMTLDFDV